MKSMILVRYGEIALKSEPVRKRFEWLLRNNINLALKTYGIKAEIRQDFGRIFIETNYIKKTISALKGVFGIVSVSQCFVTESRISKINTLALKLAKKEFKPKQTFAVKTRRVGKHDFTSQDINKKVGETIVKLGLSVNLKIPKKTLWIEVRDKKAYIYTKKIPGLGGLPLGSQGRVLALVKNSNSLLASWLMMKRGCWVVPVFANTKPEKIRRCLKFFKKWAFSKVKYYETDNKKVHDFINSVAKKERALGLVTAEIPNNTKAIEKIKTEKKLFNIPIYTTLMGFDKEKLRFYKKFLRLTF